MQVGDTQVFGSGIVNESRFQFVGNNNNRTPLNVLPTVAVQGAFTGGGNAQGNSITSTKRYEMQNYTSIALEKHFLKVGGRVRAITDSSNSTAGMNGRFTFSSLTAYQITQQGLANGMTPAAIRAAGGGANQFTLTSGSPLASVSMADAGIYFQDDWRLRSNMTFSYGLRVETQNRINDHADWAPRLAFAWGIGGGKAAPKTVVRTGVGLFYDRFSENNILQATRQNGITEQQYIISNPDFYPAIPQVITLQGLSSSVPTIYGSPVLTPLPPAGGGCNHRRAAIDQNCQSVGLLPELARIPSTADQ